MKGFRFQLDDNKFGWRETASLSRSSAPVGNIVETERLVIRLPTPQDVQITVEFYKSNREHLQKWEPTRDDEFYTEEYWENRLKQAEESVRADRAYSFYLFLKHTNRLVGIISLENIERMAFQNGRLGYKVDAHFEAQGLMREGMAAVIGYAFDMLDLRRLEANVIPENKRSLGLLKRLGFREIGLDEEYLVINGHVSAHVLTSLTKPRWAKQSAVQDRLASKEEAGDNGKAVV